KQLTVPTALNQNGATIDVDKWHDDLVPYANTYSFGVAQALPGHGVMELSYVGSASRNQILGGGTNTLSPNLVPMGAYWLPDPVTGVVVNPNPIGSSSTLNAQHYRPYLNYQDIHYHQHAGYANYNSLQVSAQKQSGNLYIFTNFTFG